jgi:hypothetical protein
LDYDGAVDDGSGGRVNILDVSNNIFQSAKIQPEIKRLHKSQ